MLLKYNSVDCASEVHEFLLERKMLIHKDGGTYRQTDPAIDTTDEIASIILNSAVGDGCRTARS
jgi:hypothetical protein